MKRIGLRLASIVVYMGAILFVTGIDIRSIFSLKLLFLMVMGTLILFLPYYSNNMTRTELEEVIGKKALDAGYIQTFILLFVCLSKQKDIESLFSNIALNCRPLLYGYCIYILLDTEKYIVTTKKKEGHDDHKGVQVDYSIDRKEQVMEDTKGSEKKTMEEVHTFFRERKLTKRETEMAYAICQGMTNREIAETFYVSEATVKKHISHIFEKLGIQKREEIKAMVYKQIDK